VAHNNHHNDGINSVVSIQWRLVYFIFCFLKLEESLDLDLVTVDNNDMKTKMLLQIQKLPE